MSSLHEECGVFGVYSNSSRDVATTSYYGLFALQHRGQESAGIATSQGDK
ncbi:MAG: amidophosphoribosyltransferase, partial [Oscillospiraceae bacterium]